MSQPNVKLVIGKNKKKKKNKPNKPTKNPYWSQVKNMNNPVKPILIQPPIQQSQTQSPIKQDQNKPSSTPGQNQPPAKLSPNQPSVRPGLLQAPVRPGLLQVPVRAGLLQHPTRPALQSPVRSGLNQSQVRLQTQISRGKLQPAFRPVHKNLVELVDDNSPNIPGTAVTAAKSKAANIVINTAANNATSTVSSSLNTTANIAVIKTVTNAAIVPSADSTNQAGPKVVNNKQKKKKWFKLLEQKTLSKEAEVAAAANETGNQPEEGNGTAQSEANNQSVPSNETLKPVEATATKSTPTTSATVAPTVTPTAAPKTSTAQGQNIPTLQTQGSSTNTRSSAGSFFKGVQPQQLKPMERRMPIHDIYAFSYPKGIPRSFLVQQQPGIMQPSGIISQHHRIMLPQPGMMPQETGIQQTITSDSPIWPMQSPTNTNYQPNIGHQQPSRVQPPAMAENNMNAGSAPIFVETENQVDVQQPYSPSDIYSEQVNNPEPEDCESSEINQSAQKRLSAFQRLGPVSHPKKPKLTINLMLNKEQPVREVVNATDDDPDRYTPVHLRQNIIMSTDETVMKYLVSWPWRKNVGIRRSATARNSRSVMILEQEQMEEVYDKDNCFVQIMVKGYPSTWTKERVLDAVLDSVKGYSLIPCFTEFYQHECKFLTLRSRSALIILHKTGFYIHRDGVELTVTISQTDLTLKQIDFIPRIILRKRIAMGYEDKKLNLSAFTLQDDISHFIYFPLSRVSNQSELMQLQSTIDWNHLTVLDLSHNRLRDISGFDLLMVTPRLKELNLSHNYLEKITVLVSCRDLPLKTIHLEGNPLCNDYIDPEHYIKVVRMMFPAVVEIDGIPLHRKGELPQFKQNYCPEDAKEVAEKFLEVFFPLLDSDSENRSLIQGMYEDDATLTVTYCYNLRFGQIYRTFRNLFLYARFLDEGETDSVVGAMAITKLINRWPQFEHDPFSFTVDVMYHSESTSIIRINGILRLTAETLAEDEYLLAFTRTVVLYTEDETEYRIQNEMVYWYEPSPACARAAFRVNMISQKKLNLKIESTTDEDLREKLLVVFMKLTTMDKKISQRCLELNSWNFKLALEHFTKLLKLNNLDSLTREPSVTN